MPVTRWPHDIESHSALLAPYGGILTEPTLTGPAFPDQGSGILIVAIMYNKRKSDVYHRYEILQLLTILRMESAKHDTRSCNHFGNDRKIYEEKINLHSVPRTHEIQKKYKIIFNMISYISRHWMIDDSHTDSVNDIDLKKAATLIYN